jgi:predicted DNA-binding antitoxin AbrB/MazE fold protein
VTVQGIVKNGVVVLDSPAQLPDGTRVEVVIKENEKAATTLGQRLLKLAGIAEGLPSDMAEQHDHYIHGTPKR